MHGFKNVSDRGGDGVGGGRGGTNGSFILEIKKIAVYCARRLINVKLMDSKPFLHEVP